MKQKMVQKRSFLKWITTAEVYKATICLNIQVAQNSYVTKHITADEARDMVDWLNMDETINAVQGLGDPNSVWIGDTMARRAS